MNPRSRAKLAPVPETRRAGMIPLRFLLVLSRRSPKKNKTGPSFAFSKLSRQHWQERITLQCTQFCLSAPARRRRPWPTGRLKAGSGNAGSGEWGVESGGWLALNSLWGSLSFVRVDRRQQLLVHLQRERRERWRCAEFGSPPLRDGVGTVDRRRGAERSLRARACTASSRCIGDGMEWNTTSLLVMYDCGCEL